MRKKLRSVRKRLQCVHQGLLEILLILYVCRKILVVLISIVLLLQGFPAGLDQLNAGWGNTA